ncbi:MAG TPA: ABC transporter ATP-binding protein [Bacteroidota bacterium]|jgi:heme exporter protein A
MIEFEAHAITKTFNRRSIFRDISVRVQSGEILRVIGQNGAGKSTFVKILAQVLTPTSGEVRFSLEGHAVKRYLHNLIGFVSPYMQLYDEFTAEENLLLSLSMRARPDDMTAVKNLLGRVSLGGRGDDQVRTFSSGMKQRLKYAFALIHQPPILILDEPMSNLDTEGIATVRQVMEEQQKRGILVVATNDHTDLENFDHQVDLGGRS